MTKGSIDPLDQIQSQARNRNERSVWSKQKERKRVLFSLTRNDGESVVLRTVKHADRVLRENQPTDRMVENERMRARDW